MCLFVLNSIDYQLRLLIEQPKLKNLQQFATINFDNLGANLSQATGFTIALGKIDAAGNVTGATTTDPLTDPINYFHVLLGGVLPTAISGTVGGGENNSAGPVTLEVVNG